MVIQTSLVSALRKISVSCGYWLFAFSFNYLVLYVYSDFVILLRMPFFLTRWLFYLDRHYYVKAFQDFITNALLFNVAAFVTRGILGRGWRYIYRSLSVLAICCYLCLYSYTYWSVFVVFVLGSWSVLLIKLLLEKLYNNLCFFFTESIAFFVYFIFSLCFGKIGKHLRLVR